MITTHDISIRIGPSAAPIVSFPASNIKSIDIYEAADAAADTLPIGELSATLLLDEDAGNSWAPMDYLLLETSDSELLETSAKEALCCNMLEGLIAGTEIYTTFGSRTEKHYLRSIRRTGKYEVLLSAQDAIGVLAEKPWHMGGLYSGESFGAVCAEIFGGSAEENEDGSVGASGGYVPATIAADIAAVKVYGHLPAGDRRSNLHALLFAYGAIVQADANGDPLICFPSASAPTAISDAEIYDGDSITESAPCGVTVTEHGFGKIESLTPVLLFDNTDGSGAASSTAVIFQTAPVWGLATEGDLEIEEAGPNYAVLSGTGRLYGTPYAHSTRDLTLYPGGSITSDVIRISDNALISPFNSSVILRRILSYIAHAKTLQADILIGDLRPGDPVTLSNAFGQTVTALIQTARITPSAATKAGCELIVGFDTQHVGTAYDMRELLTGTGTWQVPSGVTFAFVRIGAGGSGGDSGADAQPAAKNTEPGTGGTGGKGGSGGKVLAVTVDLTPGETISYTCGAGGRGGICSGADASEPGGEGGSSRFGQFSTDSGAAVSDVGVADLLDRTIVRSAPGIDGVAGAAGSSSGASGLVSFGGQAWTNGAQGETRTRDNVTAQGGYGGGAAVGADGGAGSNGSVSRRGFADSGNGGAGADAIAGEDAVGLGCGGNGGHGGGGGGAAGGISGASGENAWIGSAGAAGRGSDGGDGGAGYVEIYYKGGGA